MPWAMEARARASGDGRALGRLDSEFAGDQLHAGIRLQQGFHARLDPLGEAAIVIEELDDGDIAIRVTQKPGIRVVEQRVGILGHQRVAGGALVGIKPGLIGLFDQRLIGGIHGRGHGGQRRQQQDSKKQRLHGPSPLGRLCPMPLFLQLLFLRRKRPAPPRGGRSRPYLYSFSWIPSAGGHHRLALRPIVK
ncbi:MAG: hypothetical protein U1E93_13830 [Alphaproteobacteria bacterium]